MRIFTLTFFAVLSMWSGQAFAAVDCSYDRGAMLALQPKAFDGQLGEGWRIVGDREGCEAVAADLIAAYGSEHSAKLVDRERQSLKWHEAQLRAAAGQTQAAIALFDQARPPAADVERNVYADATIAFLRKDHAALLEARRRYQEIPPPEGFAAAAAKFQASTGQVLSWPVNTKIIDGFVNCFGKPYGEAYSLECQVPKPAVP